MVFLGLKSPPKAFDIDINNIIKNDTIFFFFVDGQK